MRKHLFPILFLLAAAAIWWASFSSMVRNPVADNNNPIVVVSGYVPYTLTKQLAGDTINLIMLLPPGTEPHAFEPTPGVLVSLKHANAYLYMSEQLEPWAADLARSVPGSVAVVKLADVVPASSDPHVWMSLSNAELLAQQITQVLIRMNPGHQLFYEENLKKFTQEINALAQQYQTTLAHCQTRQVVHIGHLAFENLTRAYGLQLTALAGTSHEGEHSAQKLAALVDEINARQIPAIFTEDTLSPRLAQTVAQETGAQILPLYPIEHISKTDFNANVTYAELMRRNLQSLARGLVCQAS